VGHSLGRGSTGDGAQPIAAAAWQDRRDHRRQFRDRRRGGGASRRTGRHRGGGGPVAGEDRGGRAADSGQAHTADYGGLDDVRRLAADLLPAYERIDILANNAGAIFTSRTTSADGHEMTFQVNYLAPFLLTNLLLARLAAAPGGARVTGSSPRRPRTSRPATAAWPGSYGNGRPR
jgi:NAD(P)-dependent dehydrogenase (short-subunit alcohol dehydrogenase family)